MGVANGGMNDKPQSQARNRPHGNMRNKTLILWASFELDGSWFVVTTAQEIIGFFHSEKC